MISVRVILQIDSQISIWEYGEEEYVRDEDEKIVLDEYGKPVTKATWKDDYERVLISQKAATRNLTVSFSNVTKSGKLVTI